jgi:8-oxo-dGTP diphosphatase
MGWAQEVGDETVTRTESPVRFRRGVKAMITSGSAVLLIKERHSDGTHFWTFPGGGIRPGESHAQALRRELREELDCEIEIRDPVGTVWYAHSSQTGSVSRYTVVDCHITSRPSPNQAEGVYEYRWANPGSLPPRTLPQIRRLLPEPEHASRSPETPAQ